jgi:hypothetical protein
MIKIKKINSMIKNNIEKMIIKNYFKMDSMKTIKIN